MSYRLRYNEDIRRMPTLRINPVKPVIEEARGKGLPIIESNLGDTGYHPGFGPYPPILDWRIALDLLKKRYMNPAEEVKPSTWRIKQLMAIIDGSMGGEGFVRRAYSYTDALGLPELREVLSRWWYERRGYQLTTSDIITGGGVSGVVRTLFDVFRRGGNILMADWAYILFPAEAILSGMETRMFPMRSDGSLDINMMVELADASTNAIVVTTVGNPIGRPMSNAQVVDILKGADAISKKIGATISVIFDTTYEIWKSDRSSIIDPLRIFHEVNGSLDAVCIVVDGFSKMFGITGERVGWLAHHWPHSNNSSPNNSAQQELFNKLIASSPQRELGTAPTSTQVACMLALKEIMGEIPHLASGAGHFEQFRKQRIETVECNVNLLKGLLSETSFNLPVVYEGVYDAAESLTISPYLVIEHPDPRGLMTEERPLGWWLARFAIDSNLPVPATTPVSAFRTTQEGKEESAKQTRLVLLISDEDMAALCMVLRRFDEAYARL